MGLLSFLRKPTISNTDQSASHLLESFLDNYSIEVTPRTADKVSCFKDILPRGSCVYIAHIKGTPIEEMISTARRLANEGFTVVPHFPARFIEHRGELAQWIAQYQGEAGVTRGLLLGGGLTTAFGKFDNSMQMIETGLFEKFDQLQVAGHPEGNKAIDPNGSDEMVMQAIKWKYDFAQRTDTPVAITTQFCFEAAPIIAWADRLANEGVDLPIHIGIAGPAKLHTLLRYAVSCGVGPSMQVLQRRAKDVSKLLLPYDPKSLLTELASHKERNPNFAIEKVHFFPLGGIEANANWVADNVGPTARPTR